MRIRAINHVQRYLQWNKAWRPGSLSCQVTILPLCMGATLNSCCMTSLQISSEGLKQSWPLEKLSYILACVGSR